MPDDAVIIEMPDDADDAYTSTQDTLPPFSDQSVIAPSQSFLSTHRASAFPLPFNFPEENQHGVRVQRTNMDKQPTISITRYSCYCRPKVHM